MNLTGKQVKQIHSALLDSYSPDSLRRLLRVHLEENLHNISSGGNFSDQVFTLVEWAERQGRVVELVRAAHEETPNNATLQTLWRDLQSWFALPAAATLRQAQGTSEQTVGEQTVGEQTVGEQTVGEQTVGEQTVGEQTVGEQTVGEQTVGEQTVGEPAEPPPAQLFLSYSRHDTPTMQRLRIAIEAAGMTVWTDDGLEPGTTRWQTAIEKAIRQTQAMVVILSPAAKQSEWVNIEVSVALRLQRRVFPVLVQGDDIEAVPINLFTTQHVDARSDLAGPVAIELLPALRKHLGLVSVDVEAPGRAPTEPPAPPTLPPALVASLRTVLATLYPDESSARRVTYDAGINVARIAFAGRAVDNWHALVQEADKTAKLADLLAVAVSDYGENAQLQQAVAALRSSGAGVPAEKPRTTAEQPQPQPAVIPPRPAKALLPVDFDWVTIPVGDFLMGSDKKQDNLAFDNEIPQHPLTLPAYRIARTPVTNAQYKVFVDRAKHGAPRHWENGQIPQGKELHPVVYVDCEDAQAFCQWLSTETGQIIRLPSEAEWEKAARGADGRIWPWGNNAPTDKLCNFNRNVGDTTPVGDYPQGASPYGCLDMAGNVWEWTNTLYKGYPYKDDDGREDAKASGLRTLRGGSWIYDDQDVRCAYRYGGSPDYRHFNVGFRVVSPGS